MSLVEILGVSPFELDQERLLGFHVDDPAKGRVSEVYAFDVAGWVLGRTSRAVAIELHFGDRMIRSARVSVPRPDVAARHAGVPGLPTCGFWTPVGVLGMAPEFELLIQAVLEDESRVPLAVIRVRHRPLSTGYHPRLQPLLVTTLGRTGSTWLMHLLTEHPQILAFRRYPYEIGAGKYWMHMLRVLAEPANHLQSSHWADFADRLWTVGHHPFYTAPLTDRGPLRQWFGCTYVNQLATLCQQSIDGLYEQIAFDLGRNSSAYFAEKFFPDGLPWVVWELYPQAREVILVRDFRDMVCSIQAENARRGAHGFGREHVVSDEAHIDVLGQHALHLLSSWKGRSDRAVLLRYEDLVLQPVESLETLLSYLGLDRRPEVIAGMIQRALAGSTDLLQHPTSPDAGSSIGRWRRDLDPSSHFACRRAFDSALREFGYAVDPVESG